jgi:Predicted membrane protein/domain
MDEHTTNPEETGLAEELNKVARHEQATTGQRFLNFLIDNLLMRYGLSLLTGYIAGYIMGLLFPEYTARIIYDESTFDLLIIGYVLSIFNYVIYYTFCEKVFKGYTLGKLITGTRAIREDGEELTFRDCFPAIRIPACSL